jgi:hypothetical protein
LTSTALHKKLGIRESAQVRLVNAPTGFDRALGPLPAGASLSERSKKPDVIVFFTTKRADLEKRFETLARALDPTGGLWIAWPKKASGVETDLSQTEVMEVGLASGLVDNKVCAIDDTWSGLRFVVRKENRPR